jgi:hypothetical protein
LGSGKKTSIYLAYCLRFSTVDRGFGWCLSAFFSTFQKATLGTQRGYSVLQQHQDLAFRSLCFSIADNGFWLVFVSARGLTF